VGSRALAAVGLREAVKQLLFDFREAHPGFPIALNVSPPVGPQLERIMNKSQLVLQELEAMNHDGPRVLFVHMHGSHYLLGLETFLAHRLRFEGAQPVFMTCEKLPWCNNRRIDAQPDYPGICADCLKRNMNFVTRMQLPIRRLSDFTTPAIYREAKEYVPDLSLEACIRAEYHGVPIGELCEVSVARYLCKDALVARGPELQIWRDFIASSVILVNAYEKAFEEIAPDILIVNSGRFFWYAIAHYMAVERGMRAFSYEGDGGKGARWFFRDTITASSLELGHIWDEWKDVPLTSDENKQLDDYLNYRSKGTMISGAPGDDYYTHKTTALQAALAEAKLPGGRPVVVMFTNLTFDSQVAGRRTIFRGMMEWVRETVRYVAGKDFTLVVRVHPAELLPHEGEYSRERTMDSLAEHRIGIPENVILIPPESQASSYALLEVADAVIVYTSTMGLEAIIHGCPVIISGLAHYWQKGFGNCPKTRREYFELLGAAPGLRHPSAEEIALARCYAYLLWFRTMIPLQIFETAEPFVMSRFSIRSLEDIRPGRNPYLDLVADAIMNSGSFVIPRELLEDKS